MMRLAVSVEGPTEREFFNRVVVPYLYTFNVVATPIVITTKRVLDGPNHKGGCVSIDRVITQVRPLLYSYDKVTTFYDFYGFDGRAENDTAADLSTSMAKKLNNPQNFIAYIQQYEFESLLFSDCAAIGQQFESVELGHALQHAVAEKGMAEKVNDSYATCPSRRISSAVKAHVQRNYDKVFHGPMLAEKIGLAKIRNACPLFSEWLAKLESI